MSHTCDIFLNQSLLAKNGIARKVWLIISMLENLAREYHNAPGRMSIVRTPITFNEVLSLLLARATALESSTINLALQEKCLSFCRDLFGDLAIQQRVLMSLSHNEQQKRIFESENWTNDSNHDRCLLFSFNYILSYRKNCFKRFRLPLSSALLRYSVCCNWMGTHYMTFLLHHVIGIEREMNG